MAGRPETQVAQVLSICQVCKAAALAPRLLPCLHAICGTCLEKLLRHDNKDGCPTCHVTLVGVHKIKEVPENNLAQLLLERNEKDLKTFGHICIACSLEGKKREKSAATVWCTICTEYFCDKCNHIHQQVTSGQKTHEVIRISQLRKEASFRNRNTLFRKSKEMCSTHPKQVLNLYCDQCERPICRVCEKDVHQDHPYLPLSDATNDYRTEIRNNLSMIEGKVSIVKEAIEAWNMYETNIEQSEKDTLESIDKYANELISLVQSWHKQCLHTLQSATDKAQEEIDYKKKDYLTLQLSLETAMMYSQRLLLHGKDGFVTCVKKNVVDRLQDLNDVVITKPGRTFSFSFQRMPDVETNKIFGNLIVEQDDLNSDELFIMKEGDKKSTGTEESEDAIRTFKAAAITDRLEPWITGVSCTARGKIVVADHRNNVLKVFADDGKFKQNVFINETLVGRNRFLGPSQSIWDCAWLPNGTIVTASVDGLHIFSINSELVCKLDDKNEHTSVTVTPTGDIVSYNDTKGQVSIHNGVTRSHIRSFSVYEKHSIGWISKVGIDHHGNILVCDVNRDSIKIYAPNGSLILEIGSHGKDDGAFIRIRGVCSDATGNLLAVDKGNHRIQKLSLDGTLLKCLMTKAEGLESPSSITMYGQTKVVIVTDKGLIHILPHT